MFQTSTLFAENFNSKADIVVNQGGTDCFAPDTLVITERGSVKISKLKNGDKVLSHDFGIGKDVFKPVLTVFRFDNQKRTIKITFKNGKTIICTEDHKFFFRGGWVEAKKLVSLLNDKMEGNTGL